MKRRRPIRLHPDPTRGVCPACGYRVRLRANGRVGAHRYRVYDGYCEALRTCIGFRQCSGAGLRVGDPRPEDPGPLVNIHPAYRASSWRS